MVHSNTHYGHPGPHLHLSPQTEHIVTALRFCLMREANGEYRFTKVHLDQAATVEPRAQFLIDLMNNRTLREVLQELTPTAALSAAGDSRTARELRAFFVELETVLEQNPEIARGPAAAN